MVQIHILQICWQEEIGYEFKTFHGFCNNNAERLDAMNEGKTPASSAPGTKVHELIKHLRPYLKIG